MSSKRKRAVLSFTDRLKIIDQLKNGASGPSLARKYGVGNATISDIKKNSDAIENYASALDNEDGNLYRKAMKIAENKDLDADFTHGLCSYVVKGREKVNDDQHTGRPRSLRCEENKLKIKALIKSNRRISIKDLSSETGLSVGLCHQIVTKDLDMIRTSSKFVPWILTEEQKEVRMDVCKKMAELTRTDPEWMQKIITGYETWVYQYDPETKRQSSQWIERGEPKPKKARFTKSKVMTLLVTFFYINGLVHHEFIPFGRTINQEVYLGIMRRLREAVGLKRPERWQNNDWILHVDNARPHTAHVVLQFLAKHSNIQIPHPPYSPDLALNDFFLYPKLKMKLKGRKFDNVDMIQAESKATLRNLSKSDFISCFDNWKKRWNRCIEAGRAYFEKY
ncbi:hypothetical protein LAZ67_6002586 [Cordylochernes scorpioides]|uniref:HTH psq-type domain-containing protein n=1 Tax=Cordylochernes scorpioides TaxID=51811 RepID=A0ABY6KJV4_9ARAC|nr:hypothetical protein LAZ67_6002586 [Cordylochernes scorpioides]